MADEGTIRLTVFLKHDQSKNLSQLDDELYGAGFWAAFPPEGVSVVSWQVMMGIGQVVTLELPPHKVREVNLVLEKKAWGAFRTECYLTYDFMPILEIKRAEERKRNS